MYTGLDPPLISVRAKVPTDFDCIKSGYLGQIYGVGKSVVITFIVCQDIFAC